LAQENKCICELQNVMHGKHHKHHKQEVQTMPIQGENGEKRECFETPLDKPFSRLGLFF